MREIYNKHKGDPLLCVILNNKIMDPGKTMYEIENTNTLMDFKSYSTSKRTRTNWMEITKIQKMLNKVGRIPSKIRKNNLTRKYARKQFPT